MTHDENRRHLELQRAYKEAQTYIAMLSDAGAAKDRQIAELSAALQRLMLSEANQAMTNAVPGDVHEEPTRKHRSAA